MQSEVETVIIERGEDRTYMQCIDLVTTTLATEPGKVFVRVDAIPHPYDPIEERLPVTIAVLRGSSAIDALYRAEQQKLLTEAIRSAPREYRYFIDFF